MANIVLSDLAPADVNQFSLANAEIEVPYETTDPEILANAAAHPWLDVEVEAQVVDPDSREAFGPEDDGLSSFNSIANDPDEVAAEAARREVVYSEPTAIDAGLDQGEPEYVGEGDFQVATTLAAVDEVDDENESVEDPAPNVVEPVEPASDPKTDEDDEFASNNDKTDGGN
jgi:hypothetical protein